MGQEGRRQGRQEGRVLSSQHGVGFESGAPASGAPTSGAPTSDALESDVPASEASASDARALDIITQLDRRPPTPDETLALFEAADADPAVLDALCAAAVRVRDREMAGRVEREAGLNSVVPCYLRPLCQYCPYWRQETSRPMPIDELLGYVRYLRDETDVRQFHLSGGSKRGQGDCGIVRIVEAIRDAGFDDMDVVVNCGASFSDADLARLKELRVKRIFSVFETTNPEVFAAAKPGDDLREKLDFARRVAAAGIEVGSGLMAGIGPRETAWRDYTKALFDLRALPGLTAMYVSKFRHAPNVPMNDHPECRLSEARALVAMARLVLRDVHIRAAAGWDGEGRATAQAAGAGSIEVACMFPREGGGYWGR